ncbi:MAG: right-handed parallel beta-helix repeat-containing protein [Calditrichaeota bacterium]|nr:right-handed parallel beta-helix repeat-containing protein [Calditrichota bacterium]MCB9368879.1 right-handed parallel beta-helix repeat-containing protein [Calditrichota bacterium]
MSGTYVVGSAGDYQNLREVLDTLNIEGMAGDVYLKVTGSIQIGPFEIGNIPGQAENSLFIAPSNIPALTLVTTDTTQPILSFTNAANVYLTGAMLTSPAVSQPAIRFANGSHDITVKAGTFKGRGTGRIIEINGSGCENIVFEECDLRRGGEAVRIVSPGPSARGNSLVHCVIDSVSQGIYLSRQTNCSIEYCTISPNAGAAATCTAVSIATQAETDSVFLDGNTISGVAAGSGYAVAIRHNPLNSTSYLRAANNFIYGFLNTGSSQVRAIYLSGGENRIVNNSILVNDVNATGTTYAVYNALLTPESGLSLQNNILVNLESTRPAYNIFNLTAAAALESNNNLFYGTGAAYKLGWLIEPFVTLGAWKSGTSLDGASKEGDPQFVSTTDLHLQETTELAHQNGAVALDVPKDHDGQIRFQPPDIGADEYTFSAPPQDAAILSVIGMPRTFPEYSLLRLEVFVQNRGSSPLVDLPLRLSYDDTARAEVIVNLQPSASDTALLIWSTGASHSNAALSVEAVLAADANPLDNGRTFELAVTGHPLAGVYRVGGFNADFQSLSEAGDALKMQGVADPVTIYIAEGFYSEPLLLDSISGLGPNATLSIRPAPEAEGIVMFAPSDEQYSVMLRDVSYVTIEGIVVQGTENSQDVVILSNGSHNNVIRNCSVTGASIQQSGSSAICVSPGCNGNRFENLQVASAYNGFRLDGESSTGDTGNEIRGCTIQDVRTGIHALWQVDLLIETCEISAGFEDAPSPCYGIRIGSLRSGDTVRVYDNAIAHCLSTGNLTGLSCESGSGTVQAVNNRISQFEPRTGGILNAVSVASGLAELYFNTISIGNLDCQQVTGISISGHQTAVSMLNNIVSVEEPDAVSRFIEWTDGEIESNNNLYDAPGSNTQFRFAHSSLDGEYASLSSWTETTGQDSFSVSTAAGFISESNLHIRPDAFGPSNNGIPLPGFATDMDGETRGTPPDIGADEYEYNGAITDIAVTSIELPVVPLSAATSYNLLTVLHNVGQNDLVGVPVRLCYNLVPVDSQTVSIAAGQSHDVYWNWTAPDVNLSYGSLRVEVSAPGDAVPENNQLEQAVVVAGAPLGGSLRVASEGADFASLTMLAEHLKWRGINSQTSVFLSEGNYTEPLVLSNIPGADSLHQLVIMPEPGAAVTISAENANAVIELLNTDYTELRDLTVVCGENSQVGLCLDAFSCHNVVENCTIIGPGTSFINSVGVQVEGAECHGNLIENSRISGCYVGVLLSGDPVMLSQSNVVIDNEIDDVYYGVWVDHQRSALVAHNDIRPGTLNGPAGACYGVYVLQLGTGGSVRIDGNEIHDFIDTMGPRTNRAAGVYSAPGISSSVEIVNNFIYGFSGLTTLRTRAIYLSSGSHLVANNSIRLDDAPADNETAGIYVSTGTQHEIYNNCVMDYENDVASYALDIESAANVVSDYNCYWGNSSSFRVAGVGSQDFVDLASWVATGQDGRSLEEHARYNSSSDLHIRLTDSTMYERGLPLPQVLYDFDGDLRSDPPCIGADEYAYLAVLDAPSNLIIYSTDGLSVTLQWQPVFAATSYRIFAGESITELQNAPVEFGQTSATSWTWDESSSPDNFRFFRVTAE